jgi:ParB family chromosome partitioning protein
VLACQEGWSVRVTEDRARRANAREQQDGQAPPPMPGVHPDQAQAASEIAQALTGALGAEVRVKATRDGRYRAELSFSTPEEAIELVRNIGLRSLT